MGNANTIGRMVGQSPASKGSPQGANPAMQLLQQLQQLQSMFQQLSGMIQQLAGGGGGGGGGGAAPPGGAPAAGAPAGEAERAGAPFTDTAGLQARLTALGGALRPSPESMEGPPSPAQALRRAATESIVARALEVGGPQVPAAHRLDLERLAQFATETARALPTPAQGAQAVDAAETMARMRGAGAPTVQTLQQVLGLMQQAMSMMQQATGGANNTNGAQIKQ